MTEPIFLFGAGGHGRAVSEVVHRQGAFEIVAVLDDDPAAASPHGTPAVSGGHEALAALARSGPRRGVVAIGDNAARERLSGLALAAGLELVTVVDPSGVVARDAALGAGAVVMALAFVGAGVRVGRGAIVNTSATVDHDCVVDEYAHVAPGVHTSGGCVIGRRAFVGAGAAIAAGMTIGADAIVGAGAAVVADVAPGVVAAGVPARPLPRPPVDSRPAPE
jgi:sugar O-acyltransferase (sialic acid O-acetyltransferase NeuD family)